MTLGDGRADLIWTDKFKGDATVWTNQGMVQSGDSSFTWVNKGPLYNAPAQGKDCALKICSQKQ